MNTIYKTLSMIMLGMLCMTGMNAQEDGDSVVLVDYTSSDMPTSSIYTLTLKNFQLKDKDSEAVISIRVGESLNGADIHITADKIDVNNTTIAENMPDGLGKHDYTFNRLTSLRVYRDGTLYGGSSTKSFDGGEPRVVLKNVSQVTSYEFEVTSSSTSVTPVPLPYESNTSNMLEGFTNLSPDPYLNTGFGRNGANASGREFWTQNAKNLGWGSDIWAVSGDDAYSGSSVKLEGQSVESMTGASLKQSISFTAGTPYVVRAMVKSDGWEGKIGIIGESNHIDIYDTNGEWKQVEAVLIPQSAQSNSAGTLEVSNADYDSNGTLLIDNIEVYKGLTGTTIGSNPKVASANISATTRWSPAHEVDVHRLGMTENSNTTYSQINPERVTVSGAAYLTRTFEGSRMNGIFLPNGLGNVTVTGRFDYRDHYEYHLYHGIDFICQRLNPETGKFEYLCEDDEITAGGYIIQFADNYDGMPIRFDLNPSDKFSESAGTYVMKGNGDYCDKTVEEDMNVLYFDEDNQQFNRVGSQNSNATNVRPFMPYICTAENIHVISPEGTTGIRLLNTAQGTDSKYLVRAIANGVEITGHGSSNMSIYSISGQRIKMVRLEEGTNTVYLHPGIYIVGGKKVMVK